MWCGRQRKRDEAGLPPETVPRRPRRRDVSVPAGQGRTFQEDSAVSPVGAVGPVRAPVEVGPSK